MSDQTIDLTPNVEGVVAFARDMLRAAPPGSRDATTARKLLAECGIAVVDQLLPEHRDRVWRRAHHPDGAFSWNDDRGMWHDERYAEADRAAWISQDSMESLSSRGPYIELKTQR